MEINSIGAYDVMLTSLALSHGQTVFLKHINVRKVPVEMVTNRGLCVNVLR